MDKRPIKVLWADDEPHFLEPFIDVLNSDPEFELKLIDDIGEALRLLEERNWYPDILIWDMIQPSGSLPSDETEGGLMTGGYLFARFRSVYPTVPALLLTNVAAPETLARYDNACKHSWVLRKRNLYLAEELVEKIRSIVGHSSQGGERCLS